MADEAKNINTNNEEVKEVKEAKKTVKKPRKVKSLKDKVCEILNITELTDKERIQGGVCKFFDLGNIPSSLLIPTGKYKRNEKGEEIPLYGKKFIIEREKIVREVKTKLKSGLGEDYKRLTVEIKMFKPKFGATKNRCFFKVGVYIYGPDFPRLIKQVGKNKNVKIIT
jgi:hypothetical protein